MRYNPKFVLGDLTEMRRIVDENPFATMISDTPDGLVASHYAMMLDPERDDLTIVAHVGRPDERLHGLGERELLVIFAGPHGYISPSWYGDGTQVPTWNYSAVHLAGVPVLLSDAENLRALDRLVQHFERHNPEPRLMWEPPNDPAAIEQLATGTVGFRLTPTRVSAKRKMSQNKPADLVERVIAELQGDGPFAHPQLAAEMRRVHPAAGE
ncbi:MAG TPA: FMN-binding negative transcriptional regulator [Microbacterium sp.]|uniref:FMN-binding negative transcriptional regulator n=1 Tax=Microbacterium sp. TaxID=51671 RepID=UPI002B4736C0|nr:FMN-binding negative transcriptional regulator [Microbacterium sp.]HKT55535.1 FMN-binding negative transcriptional regulator [Microbacterium sp.]